MADVAIEVSANAVLYGMHERCGPFWTSTTVGYVIYIDSGNDVVYRKTSDGGANWAAPVSVEVGTVVSLDCWADWQTPGDAGTKIHMVYIDSAGDLIGYDYLDTSDDSLRGEDTILVCEGTGSVRVSQSRNFHHSLITKTRGGNIAVAVRYQDTDNVDFYHFFTSPDGDTWTDEASPWNTDNAYFLLFPGNEADNQDIWGVFWSDTDQEVSLKTYDDSGNSWSVQSISGSMDATGTIRQMDGVIRHSDGHLILAAWNDFDNANADLNVWDINGAGSITAKTNVLTDSAESGVVSVFINQDNDDIYVAYVKGTAILSLVKVFYQKSTDNGGNWGGQTTMQADVEDDERWISCGAVKAIWGGRFQPMWFNDDPNDLFCNTDNGISIAAPSVGWANNFNGVANAAIGKINGVAVAAILKVNGVA